jgi:hypothetical protein
MYNFKVSKNSLGKAEKPRRVWLFWRDPARFWKLSVNLGG